MKSRRELLKNFGAGISVGSFLGMEIHENMSVQDIMGNHVARYVLNPRDYLNPEATANLDIREFGENFTHELDPMNGMYNVVADVEETIQKQRGDCVNYSALAASWILYHTNQQPKLIVYAPENKGGMGHINVFDGNTIYDTGDVVEGITVSQFEDSQDYYKIYENSV